MTWFWKGLLAVLVFLAVIDTVLLLALVLALSEKNAPVTIDVPSDTEQQASEEDVALENAQTLLDSFKENRAMVEACRLAKTNRTSKDNKTKERAEFLWQYNECAMDRDFTDDASLKDICEFLIMGVTNDANEFMYRRNFKADPLASESKKELEKIYHDIQQIEDQFCPHGDPI